VKNKWKNFFEYFRTSIGKRRQIVKEKFQKDNFVIRNKNIQEGLIDALKIILKSYDDEKENFLLKLSKDSDENKTNIELQSKKNPQSKK
jgi:hypothetical protein